MNSFDVAQAFIEHCERGAPVAELASSFQRALETLGFQYFACCSHVDPLNPPPHSVVLHNYPKEWERTFSELDFQDVDPVFQHARRTVLPFFWDADALRTELTPLQQEIFAEAARLGIAHGYTVPIHLPRQRSELSASCSVVPASRVIHPVSYHALQLMAFHMYDAASRTAEDADIALPPELSRRERQCLELAAQGKSDWVAGRILGISERTVHNHIESAKRRLNVTTRVQAIMQALATQQIALGDVIRPERQEGAARPSDAKRLRDPVSSAEDPPSRGRLS